MGPAVRDQSEVGFLLSWPKLRPSLGVTVLRSLLKDRILFSEAQSWCFVFFFSVFSFCGLTSPARARGEKAQKKNSAVSGGRSGGLRSPRSR